MTTLSKEEFKTQWLAELRSGKYSQARGILRNSLGYCCLGIACTVVNPAGWRESSSQSPFFWSDPNWVENDQELMTGLSHELQNAFGLTKRISLSEKEIRVFSEKIQGFDPLSITTLHSYLQLYNDSGASFSEIADLIEKLL